MTRAFIILLSCLILVAIPLLAQEPTQPARLELELDGSVTTMEVVALPDSSLLLYKKVGNAWNSKASFEFTKYDHQLKKVWSKTHDIDSKSEYITYAIEQPNIHLVFDAPDSKKYRFLKININSGDSDLSEYELAEIDAIYELRVLKGQFFVLGNNLKHRKLAFFHLAPTTGNISLLPSVYGNESYFTDLEVDSERERADAVLLESNGRVSHLQIKAFSPGGELVGNYFTPPQRDKLLLHTEITAGDTINKLLIGAYGTKSVEYTTGFFTMPLIDNEGAGNFYSFLDFENSLKHLKPRQEKKVRRREQQRLEKRKSPYLRHKLLLHDLIATSEGYILGAEVYTTQYDNIRSNRVHLPNMPFLKKEELFKHSQVLVAAFDKKGKLLWDNNFKLQNIVTAELEPTVEIASTPDGRVIVAYPDEKNIVYSVMKRGKFNNEKTKIELKGSSEGDKIVAVEEHGIISWYGANFAAFGFQRVRPAKGEGRSVFYINKIAF